MLSQLQSVNKAMQKDVMDLTIGVLDIYGFEIFMVGCNNISHVTAFYQSGAHEARSAGTKIALGSHVCLFLVCPSTLLMCAKLHHYVTVPYERSGSC